MLLDNDNYTERQKAIIRKIGSEHRENIDKDKKRFILISGGPTLLLVFVGIALIIFSQIDPVFIGFLLILYLLFLFLNINKKNKQFNNLKEQDDYAIGLFYGNSDPGIKGYADKKLKAQKIASITLTICGFLMAGFVLMVNLNVSPRDFSSLTSVQGVIEEAHYYRGQNERIEITFRNDEMTYLVSSLYVDQFDWDEFYEIADNEHTMTLLCSDVRNEKRNVYYAEIKGVELLTPEEVLLADANNTKLGWFICVVFGVIALVAAPWYPIYKATRYKKNKSKEIYDLNYTDEEFKEIEAKNNEVSKNNDTIIYLKTSYPKWMLYLLLGFCFLGVVMVLGGFFVEDPTGFWSLLGLGLFFIVIGGIGIIDLTKNYEVLDGRTLLVKRFFKQRNIMVQDIKRININSQYTIFIEKNGKTLCRISNMTRGLSEIVGALEKQGIRIEMEQKSGI